MSLVKKIINAVMAFFGYVPKQDDIRIDNKQEPDINKDNIDKKKDTKHQTFNIIDCDVISVEEIKEK